MVVVTLDAPRALGIGVASGVYIRRGLLPDFTGVRDLAVLRVTVRHQNLAPLIWGRRVLLARLLSGFFRFGWVAIAVRLRSFPL